MTASGRRAVSELFELAFPPFSQEEFIRERGFAATANLVTRRRVLDEVGFFDSGMMTGGDVEWGRRLVGRGGRLVYAPDAVVMHPARQSVSSLVRRHRRLIGGRARAISAIESEAGFFRRRRRENLESFKMLLFEPRAAGISRGESFAVMALAALLLLVRKVESLRIRVGLDASR